MSGRVQDNSWFPGDLSIQAHLQDRLYKVVERMVHQMISELEDHPEHIDQNPLFKVMNAATMSKLTGNQSNIEERADPLRPLNSPSGAAGGNARGGAGRRAGERDAHRDSGGRGQHSGGRGRVPNAPSSRAMQVQPRLSDNARKALEWISAKFVPVPPELIQKTPSPTVPDVREFIADLSTPVQLGHLHVNVKEALLVGSKDLSSQQLVDMWEWFVELSFEGITEVTEPAKMQCRPDHRIKWGGAQGGFSFNRRDLHDLWTDVALDVSYRRRGEKDGERKRYGRAIVPLCDFIPHDLMLFSSAPSSSSSSSSSACVVGDGPRGETVTISFYPQSVDTAEASQEADREQGKKEEAGGASSSASCEGSTSTGAWSATRTLTLHLFPFEWVEKKFFRPLEGMTEIPFYMRNPRISLGVLCVDITVSLYRPLLVSCLVGQVNEPFQKWAEPEDFEPEYLSSRVYRCQRATKRAGVWVPKFLHLLSEDDQKRENCVDLVCVALFWFFLFLSLQYLFFPEVALYIAAAISSVFVSCQLGGVGHYRHYLPEPPDAPESPCAPGEGDEGTEGGDVCGVSSGDDRAADRAGRDALSRELQRRREARERKKPPPYPHANTQTGDRDRQGEGGGETEQGAAEGEGASGGGAWGPVQFDNLLQRFGIGPEGGQDAMKTLRLLMGPPGANSSSSSSSAQQANEGGMEVRRDQRRSQNTDRRTSMPSQLPAAEVSARRRGSEPSALPSNSIAEQWQKTMASLGLDALTQGTGGAAFSSSGGAAGQRGQNAGGGGEGDRGPERASRGQGGGEEGESSPPVLSGDIEDGLSDDGCEKLRDEERDREDGGGLEQGEGGTGGDRPPSSVADREERGTPAPLPYTSSDTAVVTDTATAFREVAHDNKEKGPRLPPAHSTGFTLSGSVPVKRGLRPPSFIPDLENMRVQQESGSRVKRGESLREGPHGHDPLLRGEAPVRLTHTPFGPLWICATDTLMGERYAVFVDDFKPQSQVGKLFLFKRVLAEFQKLLGGYSSFFEKSLSLLSSESRGLWVFAYALLWIRSVQVFFLLCVLKALPWSVAAFLLFGLLLFSAVSSDPQFKQSEKRNSLTYWLDRLQMRWTTVQMTWTKADWGPLVCPLVDVQTPWGDSPHQVGGEGAEGEERERQRQKQRKRALKFQHRIRRPRVEAAAESEASPPPPGTVTEGGEWLDVGSAPLSTHVRGLQSDGSEKGGSTLLSPSLDGVSQKSGGGMRSPGSTVDIGVGFTVPEVPPSVSPEEERQEVDHSPPMNDENQPNPSSIPVVQDQQTSSFVAEGSAAGVVVRRAGVDRDRAPVDHANSKSKLNELFENAKEDFERGVQQFKDLFNKGQGGSSRQRNRSSRSRTHTPTPTPSVDEKIPFPEAIADSPHRKVGTPQRHADSEQIPLLQNSPSASKPPTQPARLLQANERQDSLSISAPFDTPLSASGRVVVPPPPPNLSESRPAETDGPRRRRGSRSPKNRNSAPSSSAAAASSIAVAVVEAGSLGRLRGEKEEASLASASVPGGQKGEGGREKDRQGDMVHRLEAVSPTFPRSVSEAPRGSSGGVRAGSDRPAPLGVAGLSGVPPRLSSLPSPPSQPPSSGAVLGKVEARGGPLFFRWLTLAVAAFLFLRAVLSLLSACLLLSLCRVFLCLVYLSISLIIFLREGVGVRGAKLSRFRAASQAVVKLEGQLVAGSERLRKCARRFGGDRAASWIASKAARIGCKVFELVCAAGLRVAASVGKVVRKVRQLSLMQSVEEKLREAVQRVQGLSDLASVAAAFWWERLPDAREWEHRQIARAQQVDLEELVPEDFAHGAEVFLNGRTGLREPRGTGAGAFFQIPSWAGHQHGTQRHPTVSAFYGELRKIKRGKSDELAS